MVSTRVCGTLGSGSNPDRHPIVHEQRRELLFLLYLAFL